MFDISFAELGIVGIMGILVLGPKEMLKMLKALRVCFSSLKSYYAQYVGYLNKELEEDLSVVQVIFDDEGKPQHAYDIEKIRPLLKKSIDE